VEAREVAEGYSWDRIARRLVEIYEQLAVGATAQKAAA
jgi:glycosyltransferase involved in cell wall biosynthesis